MKQTFRFIALTLSALFLSACGLVGAPAADDGGYENQLNIFAAASLTEAFQDVEKAFTAEHPKTAIHFNFAGSQTLLTQIEQGAPADIYASADMVNMKRADEKNLVETPQTFAHNRLAIIVPKQNPAKIETYADLVKARRVILGVKDVPVGAYARQSLEKADRVISPDFSKKVYENVVSEEMNVKQIVTKVALGEGDAAFVYATDVTGKAASDVTMVDVPEQLNFVASYPIAAVKNREASPEARSFIDFLLSSKGQEIMQKHGFLPAAKAPN
jgi:molybdate transport system substrate-binding protein